MRVVVNNKNNVGRVVFNKVAKVSTFKLSSLSDVVTTGQQEGDILVYQANTNNYVFKTLPNVDGGAF